MPNLSDVSIRNLAGVNPGLVALVNMAIEETPIDFRVTDGLRTISYQKHLVAIGASKTMDSKHLTGDAIDLVPWVGGKPRWEWPVIYPLAEHIRKCALELQLSLRWGGCWDVNGWTYTVKPCKELVNDYVVRQRKAGKYVFIDGPHFELCPNAKVGYGKDSLV